MFRVDLKTGKLIASEDCHTATIPHTRAKRNTKTGNYGLADEARKLFKELVPPIDPETGKPIFPLSQSQIQAQAAKAAAESLKDKFVAENETEMPKPVTVLKPDMLWSTFSEVEAFLNQDGITKKTDNSGDDADSTVGNMSSCTLTPSEEGEDVITSARIVMEGEEEEDGAQGDVEDNVSDSDSESDEELDPRKMLLLLQPEKKIDFRSVYAEERKKNYYPNFNAGIKKDLKVPSVNFYRLGKVVDEDAAAYIAKLEIEDEQGEDEVFF